MTTGGLPAPGRSSDDAAKIAACEVRILVRKHVSLDVAECRLRLVLDAVVEGLNDVFLFNCIVRGCACRTAARSASLYSAYFMPSTSISTPAVTKATTGCI